MSMEFTGLDSGWRSRSVIARLCQVFQEFKARLSCANYHAARFDKGTECQENVLDRAKGQCSWSRLWSESWATSTQFEVFQLPHMSSRLQASHHIHA